ncbi:SDR family NAD(P)-dependent oxidoreductase [Humitalea sp. 24SJ18S-53]|uniref:SDR family NAD(P)-dependent oxidoreductase n=1 Tax=Humitalea sp. 24SJ18S-53 TaxID=3422307 RepID=UPI003D67E066
MRARTIILIGCVHGIGRAAAFRAVAAGSPIALLDIDAPGLVALAEELRSAHPTLPIVALPTDITNQAQVVDAVAKAVEALGEVEVLIVNAGGVTSLVQAGELSQTFADFSASQPADWRRIVELNLFGVFNAAHAVLPLFKRAGKGRIVLVASVAGLVGSPGLATYAAAKGGVIAFGKSLAREVAREGITVNTVAPGGVATRVFPPGTPAAQKRAERIPMGRLAEPDEIANAIMYFALGAPDYLSGEVLSVSGGPPA